MKLHDLDIFPMTNLSGVGEIRFWDKLFSSRVAIRSADSTSDYDLWLWPSPPPAAGYVPICASLDGGVKLGWSAFVTPTQLETDYLSFAWFSGKFYSVFQMGLLYYDADQCDARFPTFTYANANYVDATSETWTETVSYASYLWYAWDAFLNGQSFGGSHIAAPAISISDGWTDYPVATESWVGAQGYQTAADVSAAIAAALTAAFSTATVVDYYATSIDVVVPA